MKQVAKPSYIWGGRATIEAILAGKTVSKIFIDRAASSPTHKALLSLIRRRKVPYSYVPVAKLNRLTTKDHQGVVAYLAPVSLASLSNVVQVSYEQGKTPLILLLDGIKDVRNFGAIVRTATCAGVDAIVIPSHGSVSVSREAMKTSAGALAHLPICRVGNLREAIDELKASGLQIIACHEKATKSIYHTNLNLPLAIILGAENRGIAPQHLQLADNDVHIPMLGTIASLNVSVAAAIILYEHVRQQMF